MSDQINFHVRDGQKQELRELASSNHQNLSEFIRNAIQNYLSLIGVKIDLDMEWGGTRTDSINCPKCKAGKRFIFEVDDNKWCVTCDYSWHVFEVES